MVSGAHSRVDGYVELHAHSCFSLLDGASTPEALLDRAAELGMTALALTDHDGLYAVVRFALAARERGIHPIIGAELTMTDETHLVLLAENRAGYQNLCWLISRAQLSQSKGNARLAWADLAGHTDGLIALSACKQGAVAASLLRGDRAEALRRAQELAALFAPQCCYIELQQHLHPEDAALLDDLVEVARAARLPLVASNNVHYAWREGHCLQDVLVAIRHTGTLQEVRSHLRANSEYYLKSGAELAPLFADYPEALENSRAIAERCQLELDFRADAIPPAAAETEAENARLRELCEAGMAQRFPHEQAAAQRQMEHELQVIYKTGLSGYFLLVWDIVRYAQERGIQVRGRGSAANSIVAYLLGITPIDPLAHNLVFERFLSEERRATPDIDIDFQADRREEVIQYVYQRYRPEHAAMACTLVTFRTRSALRDVGKVLGMPIDVIRQGEKLLDEAEAADSEPAAPTGVLAQVLALARQIGGFPRHLGIHNGGMLITAPPLAQRVPTEPATMADRFVVQWDKDSIEDVGLVKIDILGLRMLSAIAEALQLIEQTTGARPDLSALPFDDPAVYDMIARADTIGIFQVESRAQAQVLPQLKPHCFEDIIVSISLIRPGPLQGNMVHPYLRRHRGEEPVSYAHHLLEPALGETLGVILFQEQVLKVTRDLAGFTPGQGEGLRRALGGRNAAKAAETFRQAFMDGAQQRGVPAPIAESVFDQLKAFGGYSFPKSHAAAFAVLVHHSAWLKRYHPAAFYTALLNNQPMGFWTPAVLVRDAERHGVDVLPVHVHRSRSDCVPERGAIRLGFKYVKGFGEEAAARIEESRRGKPFASLADLCKRTRLPRRLVEHLILVGAVDTWGIQPRKLLWELARLRYLEEELELPALSRGEALALEYGILGLTTGEHVMALYRRWLEAQGFVDSRDLEECRAGQSVRVAGLVVVHQAPPTAKGFRFVTLEDEEGLMNVIVNPSTYARYRRQLAATPLLIVKGTVQKGDGVINVIAGHIAPLHR